MKYNFRMAFKQQPHEVYFNCMMVMVPGIEDDNDVNLDNVPVWSKKMIANRLVPNRHIIKIFIIIIFNTRHHNHHTVEIYLVGMLLKGNTKN